MRLDVLGIGRRQLLLCDGVSTDKLAVGGAIVKWHGACFILCHEKSNQLLENPACHWSSAGEISRSSLRYRLLRKLLSRQMSDAGTGKESKVFPEFSPPVEGRNGTKGQS